MTDRPNIRNASDDHRRYCGYPTIGTDRDWGRPGDVLRCEHGHIMLGYEVPGCTSAYWQTLSPVFNPIKYRRARRALTTPLPPGAHRPLADECPVNDCPERHYARRLPTDLPTRDIPPAVGDE